MKSILYWLLASGVGFAAATQQPCDFREITSLGYRGDGEELPMVYDVLTTCSNITALSVKLTWVGCSPSGHSWSFNFKEGDRFPPLKNLTLSSYNLEGPDPNEYPWSSHRDSYIVQAQKYLGLLKPPPPPSTPPPSNLDLWRQVMDFTQLERLRAEISPIFWKDMKNELPSLRHVSTTTNGLEGPSMEALLEFLEHAAPLESLHIHNEAPIVSSNSTVECSRFPWGPICEHQGQSLKNLTVIQSESFATGHRRVACNAEQIAEIYAACPSLTHLGLDIDRHSNVWPNATFDALIANPNLTSLHLRFEIGHNMNLDPYMEFNSGLEAGEDFHIYLEPRINSSVARMLFEDLRAKKQGLPLDRLEVELSDCPEDSYSGPLRIDYWENFEGKWICTADASGAINCASSDCMRVNEVREEVDPTHLQVSWRMFHDFYPPNPVDGIVFHDNM